MIQTPQIQDVKMDIQDKFKLIPAIIMAVLILVFLSSVGYVLVSAFTG